ncbi:hypothetical protein [Flavobacterium sp. ABG]|jgi:hypothetical protein|uniref:hypothetical protein n=1 Tax=Flavobacterium sp. ABG TaxID=1423322 RepID=UPI000699C1A6|nr:hypothetical protein [Flavobacterium sp. ABG]
MAINGPVVQKVNKTPRFSVNKLGEYMGATAARRKRIIYDQKYPSSFIVSQYREAKEAIIKYIIKDYDETVILEAIDKIKKSTILKEQEIENSVLALNEALKTNLPNLSPFKKTRSKDDNPKININGLEISVSPDIVVKNGNKIGCIKTHVIKTEQNRLTQEASLYVGVLLHQYTEANLLEKEQSADVNLCISIDCFGNSHETAPKAIARRLSNIQAACEEIVLRWDSV